jgi:predicted DNA-binding transcriptional regulator AlpA
MTPAPRTKAATRPPGELLPPGVHQISEAMEGVVERLAYRLDEIASSLGVSRRLIERERAAGRFPKPDLQIGRVPLWTRKTLIEWIADGGGQP